MKINRVEVRWAGNYSPPLTGFAVTFGPYFYRVCARVVSDWDVLWGYGAGATISLRMVLELVSALGSLADLTARGFPVKQRFTNPAATPIKLPFAVAAAEGVTRIVGWVFEVAAASRVAAAQADL